MFQGLSDDVLRRVQEAMRQSEGMRDSLDIAKIDAEIERRKEIDPSIIIVKRTTLCGSQWGEIRYAVPRPKGFIEGKRSYHSMRVESDGNLVAHGFTCCADRQYGCAYLGSCTAKKPANIEMGHITDYPEVEVEVE